MITELSVAENDDCVELISVLVGFTFSLEPVVIVESVVLLSVFPRDVLVAVSIELGVLLERLDDV